MIYISAAKNPGSYILRKVSYKMSYINRSILINSHWGQIDIGFKSFGRIFFII